MVKIIQFGKEKRQKRKKDHDYHYQLQEKKQKGKSTQQQKLRELKWEQKLANLRETAEASTKKAVMREVHRRHKALAVQEGKTKKAVRDAERLTTQNNNA